MQKSDIRMRGFLKRTPVNTFLSLFLSLCFLALNKF